CARPSCRVEATTHVVRAEVTLPFGAGEAFLEADGRGLAVDLDLLDVVVTGPGGTRLTTVAVSFLRGGEHHPGGPEVVAGHRLAIAPARVVGKDDPVFEGAPVALVVAR